MAKKISSTQQNKSDTLTRLNRYLAECGIASRRKADALITEGAVKLNGKVVYELGVKIDPTQDQITVKGRPVTTKEEKVYFAFYKPLKVVTTMSDPEGRPCVGDFFKKSKKRLFPVGRLDWDTDGLLLITNDGEFANLVSNPQSNLPKTYLVKLDGQPSQERLEKLKKGVTIPGGKVKALECSIIPKGTSTKYEWIKIVITEGKNRQIRHMFAKIGFDVKKLRRVSIGNYKLGRMKPGETRPIPAKDLMKVFEIKNI